MLASHFQFGVKKVGYIRKIHVVGFSGIVDIIWVAGVKMTKDKSNDGLLCADILCKLNIIVVRETFSVAQDKDRRYCTGLMIRGKYRR